MSGHLLLRWDSHVTALTSGLRESLQGGDLTDLTLCCQGRALHAHKLVMSLASPLIKSLINNNPSQHPIIIMRDVSHADMSALLAFVYGGEVTVPEHQLASFLQTASCLQVRGLLDKRQDGGSSGVSTRVAPVNSLEPEVVVTESPVSPDLTNNHDLGMTELALDDVLSSNVQSVDTEKDREPAGSQSEADDGRDGGESTEADGEGEQVESLDPPSPSSVSCLEGVSPVLHCVLQTSVSWQERGHYCPYCPRELSLHTLGAHLSSQHAGRRLQCKACRQHVHTRVAAPLVQHGLCVLLMLKQPLLSGAAILRLSRALGHVYRNRRSRARLLRQYPDLAFFGSGFISGRGLQKCRRCSQLVRSSSMAGHLEQCGQRVVRCQFCNKHMARARLPLHVDIYHPGARGDETPVPPPADPVLTDHIPLVYHPVFSVDTDNEDSQQPSSDRNDQEASVARPSSSPAPVTVRCPLCDKKMRHDNVRRHYRVMHADHAVPDVRALVTQEPAAKPRSALVDKHASYKGSCYVCGRVMWRKHLRAHVRSAHPGHDPEQVYRAACAPGRAAGAPALSPSPSTPTKVKVVRHCPYCWKTMWRCNVKRHIRVMHGDQVHRLSAGFDLLSEIRAAARRRGVPPPEYTLSSAAAEHTDTADAVDLHNDAAEAANDQAGGAAVTSINARVAIQEMDAMAEAEGLEAGLHEEVQHSERIPVGSRRHEKHLKRCPFCVRLIRACHLKRHILYWHRDQATGPAAGCSPREKLQVPDSRQRQCPVCHKHIVTNDLQRHIRAAHPQTDHGRPGGTVPDVEGRTTAAAGDRHTEQRQASSPALSDSPRTRSLSSSSSSTSSSSDSEAAVQAMLPCGYCERTVPVAQMDAHVLTEHSSLVDQ